MSWGPAIGLVLWALLVWAVLSVVGCGRTQVQDLADAGAGAAAYQQEADPVKRALIGDGLAARLLAIQAHYPLLPKPTHTPAEIRSDPAAYAASGADAQADPQPYQPEDHQPPPPGVIDEIRTWGLSFLRWGLWVGAIATAAIGVLWLARVLGWSPVGGLVSIAARILAPVARLAALWGSASAAVGASLVWLADYWWAVALVALAVGGVVAWIHWRDLRAWWERRAGHEHA